MLLPALLISDTHFTANPRDEYRWTIWKWLREQVVEERIRTVLFLGDLTDAKDYHPAILTNRLVREVQALVLTGASVYFLQGNHDYLKSGQSYFEFLDVLPGAHFITKSTEIMLDGGPTAMLMPHTRNPARDWKDLDFSHYDLLFIHQTIKGAKASNGQVMDGEELPALNARKVWSGDIHVPQVIGPIEYVGSPYHVHFGDSFVPRCVVLDRRGKAIDLHFESISRVAVKVRGLHELQSGHLVFRPGDQVKLTVTLSDAEKHEWSRIKREATRWLRERQVSVEGIELVVERSTRRLVGSRRSLGKLADDEVLSRFIEQEDLGADALDVGLRIIEE